MKTMTFSPGARGELTFARPPSDYIEAVALVAAASQSVPRPTGARFVLFAATGDFYALAGTGATTTAVLPAATTTDGSSSELCPGHWSLDGFVSIGLIAAADCVVTLTFYA